MTLLVTFLLTFAIVLFAITAMAVGVIKGRGAIRGSCGGLNGRPCVLCNGNCGEETDDKP